MVDKQTEKKIWDFLKSKGLSDYGVAGLMGNLYAESQLSSINLQNTSNKYLNLTDEEYTEQVDTGAYTKFATDSAGYGLAQWTYSVRKKNLLEFAKSKQVSIGDLDMQLEFLYEEFRTSYKSVLKVLKTTTSVSEASDAVLLGFEKPAKQDNSVRALRTNYSRKFFESYASINNLKIVKTLSDLHLREGMGSHNTSLGIMPKGSVVTIIEENPNGWYRVASVALGIKGYCYGKYLDS